MKTAHPNRPRLKAGTLILLWILSVFAVYAVTHKPLAPSQGQAVLLALWRMIVPLALMALAGGIGVWAKPASVELPPLVDAALTAAFGSSVIALYALAWGALIGANLTMLFIPVLALFVLSKNIARWLALWTHSGALWHSSGWFGKFARMSLGILLAARLLIALAPPLAFDALTYHFSLPQYFIQSGRIQYDPHLMFWGMPQQAEMFYLPAMLAGGVAAAAVLNWMIGALALAGLIGAAENYFDAQSAWIAAAAIMSGTMFAQSLGSGYVEWHAFLFGLATFICLRQWAERNDLVALIPAGLFAGMALSVKYTSGVVLLAGIAVIVLLSQPRSRGFKNIFVFGLCAILVFIPWLVKNFAATGNPVYPLIFPTRDFDALRMTFYNFAPMRRDWSRLILLPWSATVMGRDGGNGYAASIGPTLLAFAPLALIFHKKFDAPQKRTVVVLGISIVAGFLAWAIASQFRGLLIQTRLYAGIFPAWALLCAAGFWTLNRLNAANIRFGNIAAALAAFALLAAVNETLLALLKGGAANVVLGDMSESAYVEHNTGAYQRAMDAINALPQDARVIMLWETRGYYCLPRCDPDEIIDRWWHDWRASGDLDTLLGAWRAQGYTHVLLRGEGMNFIRRYDKSAPYLPQDWAALDALTARLKLQREFGGSYALYLLPDD